MDDAPARARCFRFLCRSALVLGLAGSAPAQENGPSLVDLAKRGARTEARLLRESAQWELTARTGAGVRYDLRVLSSPPDYEVRILVKPEGQEPHRYARVVSLDGKWYVDELGGPKGVYLPWQAPFSFELTPLLISEVWPRTYKLEEGHRFERIDGAGMVLVRVPLVDEQRTRAEQFLKQAAESGIVPGKELEQNLNEIRERLQEGNLVMVDAATGLARTIALGTMRLEYGTVRWLKKRPTLPALKDLPDFSVPLPEKRDNLVMIGHYGAWKPGVTSIDPGGRLLNLDNGKLVRIPFIGGTCMPGCFVGDRSQVAVSALDPEGGHLGLYLIDLNSGQQRRLGGSALAVGHCYAPVLSPDGKTLAVIHQGPEEKLYERRLYLVEIASGKARPLGKAFDGDEFSWLPDGSGLIGVLLQRLEKKGVEYRLAKFTLEGEVKDLRAKIGRFACIVGENRDRILYQDRDLKWFTCDLEGNDSREQSSEWNRLTDPSVSPDGKRVIMISHEQGKGMTPVIVDLASGTKTPVKVKPGWWQHPAWQ